MSAGYLSLLPATLGAGGLAAVAVRYIRYRTEKARLDFARELFMDHGTAAAAAIASIIREAQDRQTGRWTGRPRGSGIRVRGVQDGSVGEVAAPRSAS